LNYGGDEVTKFLTFLLLNAEFPYHELNLMSHTYDWLLMEEFKEAHASAVPVCIHFRHFIIIIFFFSF